ncbi:hypothetical protein CIK92_09045 [Prevotella sp. P4-67]|uniref:helix-turn-helix domain-containing protein n=1 Tax=Prevotella sp. P4-67 TaxID=2024227 RepID=UPI000B96260C|nr:helix-turn-helix domain-containing protein [Prevotella sp. P4-67]OYP70623.1 hypothetical protein CIK92_09045 [Prevotella sp. P4-67]
MGQQQSESSKEFERRILKMQVKEEVIEEVEGIISEKVKELIGPAVADTLGTILDFPLTVKQLASMTGRTQANIYKMCQRGQIPYTKVGTQIHINIKDVNDQLLCLKRRE